VSDRFLTMIVQTEESVSEVPGETTQLVPSPHDSVNLDVEVDDMRDDAAASPVKKRSIKWRAVAIIAGVLGVVCLVFLVCALVELIRLSVDNTFNKRTFLFISDLHTDPLADCQRFNQSTYCRENFSMDFSELGPQYRFRVTPGGFYGRYGCDAPKTLIDDMISNLHKIAKGLQKEPEFIINGGDIPAHSITHEQFIESFEFVHDLLEKNFPGMTVVQTIGNNDANPPYDPKCDSESLQTVADLWLKYGWLDKDQEAFFRHSGAHARTVTKDGRLRVIALNSNQFLSKSWYPATPSDDCGQLDWLDSELEACAKRDQTVLILIHAAPVIDAFNDKELWGNETQAKRFRDIIQAHNANTPGLIQGILMGHVHKDEYRVLHASDKSAMIPVIVAPAISPIYDNNPGFRVMYFSEDKVKQNGDTKKVIVLHDYDQYYTDLRASYINNATEWKHEYRFSKAYGKKTLQTNDYVSLHEDLSTHSTLMSEFMMRYAVHYSLKERETLCAFNSNDAQDYEECYNDWS